MSLLLILVYTILIYSILENQKKEVLFKKKYNLDIEIEFDIRKFLIKEDVINIFTVHEIRKMINEKYLMAVVSKVSSTKYF